MYKVPELETAYCDLCGHLTYAYEDISALIELLEKYSDIDNSEDNKLDLDIYRGLKSDLATVKFYVERVRSCVYDCI